MVCTREFLELAYRPVKLNWTRKQLQQKVFFIHMLEWIMKYHQKKVLKNLTPEKPFSAKFKMADMSQKCKLFDQKIIIIFLKFKVYRKS